MRKVDDEKGKQGALSVIGRRGAAKCGVVHLMQHAELPGSLDFSRQIESTHHWWALLDLTFVSGNDFSIV